MKKIIPFVLLAVGLVVFVVAVIFFVNRNKKEKTPEQEDIPEISIERRPFVSLLPTADGHWLKLIITKLNLDGLASLDYELLYNLSDGRTQGVPGSVGTTSEDKIERDLLLGSESSGKYRYDEGVKGGTLTLRFRDKAGKLIGKLSQNFELFSDVKTLTSPDGNLELELDKVSKNYLLVMNTFGYPEKPEFFENGNVYGVFSQEIKGLPMITVNSQSGNWYQFNRGEWTSVMDSLEFQGSLILAESTNPS